MTEPIKIHRMNYPSGRKPRRPWPPEEMAEMIHMREVEHRPWREIDARFGRSDGACACKYESLRRSKPMVVSEKLWSQADAARAAELWQLHFADHFGEERGPRGSRERVYELIGVEIGRTRHAVAARYEVHGAGFGALRGASPRQAPAEIIAERERRRRAENSKSLTASLFGDPPPGYSALDLRGGRR